MTNMLVKIGLVYLCMSLFLYLGGVGNLAGDSTYIDSFVNVSGDTMSASNTLVEAAPNVDEEQGGVGATLSFIDTLRAVRAGVRFLTGVLFAIPSLFADAGLPWIIKVLVAAPLLFVAFMSLASFVRSGS
ncbi:MAG: hypothetical protein LC650_04765 [Actinobacteria bacterium]|nr:hypothetical protein [Actinomycetota bacterium]